MKEERSDRYTVSRIFLFAPHPLYSLEFGLEESEQTVSKQDIRVK